MAAYAALDVAASIGTDAQTLRAAHLGMGWIAGWVIVPLAIVAPLSGLIIAVGTKWGLLRHWWVVISLLLTVFATAVFLVETQTISANATVAADETSSLDDLRALGNTLPHSVGGALVLIVVLGLNVYKPRGLTPYGWRKQLQERRAAMVRPHPSRQ